MQIEIGNVIEAILINSAPNTPQQQRDDAYQFLENIKHNGHIAFELLKIGVSINNEFERAQVLHYGLHCIQQAIIHQWNNFSNEEKTSTKINAINLLKDYVVQAKLPIFQHEKISRIISEIAIREWPQRWTDLFPLLLDIVNNTGSPQVHMVAIVIRNLAEEVKSFNPNLPEKRRKEIQQGLNASLPLIFPYCNQILVSSTTKMYNALQQNIDCEKIFVNIAHVCLQSIECISEFCPDELLFENKFLNSLCNILKIPNCFDDVMKVFDRIASRKMTNVDPSLHPAILPIWDICISATCSIASQFDGTSERQVIYLRRCLLVLYDLLRFWYKLLDNEESYSYNMRNQILQLLLQMLCFEKYELRRKVTDIWMSLLRTPAKNVILNVNNKNEIYHQLFRILMTINVKEKRNTLENHPEFEDVDEALQLTANLRSQYLNMVSILVRDNKISDLSFIANPLDVVPNLIHDPKMNHIMLAARNSTFGSAGFFGIDTTTGKLVHKMPIPNDIYTLNRFD